MGPRPRRRALRHPPPRRRGAGPRRRPRHARRAAAAPAEGPPARRRRARAGPRAGGHRPGDRDRRRRAAREPRGATAWLRSADTEEEASAALAVLNGLLHAQRIAAADPYGREVGRRDVLVLRLGWGARASRSPRAAGPRPSRCPFPRSAARDAALRPQERLAALLGGRDAAAGRRGAHTSAPGDLEAGRMREAACSWPRRWTPPSPSSPPGASGAASPSALTP